MVEVATGTSEEGGYGGEPAMNDRNQRNTASRKLPGIHPEYIIHTGVPSGRGVARRGAAQRRVLLWVKGSSTPERTRAAGGERSVRLVERTRVSGARSRGVLVARCARSTRERPPRITFPRCFPAVASAGSITLSTIVRRSRRTKRDSPRPTALALVTPPAFRVTLPFSFQ